MKIFRRLLNFIGFKNNCIKNKNNSSQLKIELPEVLRKNIEANAESAHLTQEAYIIKILEDNTIPFEYIKPEIVQQGLPTLVDFISKIPGVTIISSNKTYDHNWWIKFDIDVNHSLAWAVVQELGFVFNYISLTEKLPTVFMPVSPPPYLNGGPEENLAWVIESRIAYLDPEHIARILKERLPNPVDDLSEWTFSDDESE